MSSNSNSEVSYNPLENNKLYPNLNNTNNTNNINNNKSEFKKNKKQ